MLTIFASLAEFERETILERQAEGIAIALIVAIMNAFAALIAYATGHMIRCGFNVAIAIIFTLAAIACEAKILNRIKKLEEEKEKNYEHHEKTGS